MKTKTLFKKVSVMALAVLMVLSFGIAAAFPMNGAFANQTTNKSGKFEVSFATRLTNAVDYTSGYEKHGGVAMEFDVLDTNFKNQDRMDVINSLLPESVPTVAGAQHYNQGYITHPYGGVAFDF